ncbi:DegT/DnrJ/EryC1/StrS family aminotransferase [Rhodopirellula europaea]|nr:DegT/DnrJ/EryC1/StrS family aminotransferase [Rhodopirellula europaea]
MNIPLHVTKSFLPPQEEYVARLATIWKTGQLTNNGQLVQLLEKRLCERLQIDRCLLVSNGDAGLQLSIRALKLNGEVITTPFSYISTLSSLLWLGLQPVFVDIDSERLTIDPTKIEQAITSRTSAILVTHVYGRPCDVVAIEAIAKRYDLRVIYDAAHAFAVDYLNQPLPKSGDISMISLHATKLFHTGEGGLLVANDPELHEQVEWHRRFGHRGNDAFHGVGINAKMSELHAAMGLCVLDHMDGIIEHRRKTCEAYRERLFTAEDRVQLLAPVTGATENHAYFPVLFSSEKHLLRAMRIMRKEEIYPRRYFFPALHRAFPNLTGEHSLPVAESIAERVLCLPLSHGTSEFDIERVAAAVLGR